MFAAFIAVLAVAATPVATCHIDRHGNANRCTYSETTQRGLSGTLPPRATESWLPEDSTLILYHARVNGRAGVWNFDQTVQLFQHGRVQFDGVSFINYSNHAVRVSATA